MKLNKIAGICKNSGAFCLYDKVGRGGEVTQWLGDGNAIYPLEGLPYLDEDSVYRMFDVPEKKQEKIMFRHELMPEAMNVDDFTDDETQADECGVTIAWGGAVLLPIQTYGRVLYIRDRYLAPVDDEREMVQLFVRRTSTGGRYVAVKVGMLLRAVILPYNMVQEKFVERLEDIARMTREELSRQHAGHVVEDCVEDKDQETMFPGEEGADDEA